MLSHEEMIGFQAEKHELIDAQNFDSKEMCVLHLIHTFAYIQASQLAKNKKILDLGCNTGYGSDILMSTAKEVVGVDVSEKSISTAINQYGHLGITFQLIDGKRLPFEDNEFDMIVSCQVIEHIIDYDIYISELKRVLSPKGIVFFTTPNAILRLDPGMKPWNKFHVREFDYSGLESMLSTFFSGIHVLGLFASEPLYSIEVNRLNTARENARKRNHNSAQPSLKSLIKSLIKAMLPKSMLTLLKKPNAPVADIDMNYINEHGVADFFYSSNNTEAALDLLAICSDDKSSLQEIQSKLSTTLVS